MTTDSKDILTQAVSSVLEALGYELVQMECQVQRQKLLRIFIDRTDGQAVGMEDCVKVTKSLEIPLDQIPEVDQVFKGAYELEVSSPGVFRPLNAPKDYKRFTGSRVRVHLFRPLTAEEGDNADYVQKNPKQKNFVGKIRQLEDERLVLEILPEGPAPTGRKAKAVASSARSPEVKIPLSLISKANLEPSFDSDLKAGPNEGI
ncbi:ribosome maturation factor RimP [bacterium]|jgi:ribosome maturation factor RimP|nr:ribosome maturation factor RimP [bacterium]